MKKIVIYASVGGIAFIAEYITFLVLEPFVQIIVAQIVSWCIGYTVSFSGHRGVTFKAGDEYRFSRKHQFIMYGTIAVTTLIMSTFVVYGLSMDIPPQLAKLVAMITTATVSYFFLNKLVFVR